MNKKLLPALIALSMSTAAVAEPTVWGLMHVVGQYADETIADESETNINLVSHHSRLGFKGSEKLENGLEVIYHYELGIAVDENVDWIKRNSFLGVKGDFGKVIAGRFDSAFKSSQGKVDIFGDQEGDITNILTVNENRVNNTIAYITPDSLGGLKAQGQIILSEDEDVDNGFTGSVGYSSDKFYIAGALDSNVEAEDTSAARLTGVLYLGKLQLGAMVEQFDPAGDADSVSGGMVSAKFTVGEKVDLKAQYGSSDIKEEGATAANVGVDYRMTKTFKLTSYLTINESDEGTEETYLGAGAVLKF